MYDMIDSQGYKGLAFSKACKRLGISKRTDTYLDKMAKRFGMHVEEGSQNGVLSSRVWTRGNFNPQASYILPSELEDALDENGLHSSCVGQGSAQIVQGIDHWTSKADAGASGEYANVAVESGLSHCLPTIECNDTMAGSNSSQNLACEVNCTVSEEAMPPTSQLHESYLCLNMNAVRVQREQRILEMLQEHKFLIKPELHRQLTRLEKEKQTMMDRKTLDRSLSKLQQEGHCKCIGVSVPCVTNCRSSRTIDVVLHPSVYNVTPDLLGQIYERLRSFEMKVRKTGQSVSVLNGIEGIQRIVKSDVNYKRSEAMQASQFVSGKMVRMKLLHIFLWGYLSSSPDWGDALSSGEQGYDRKNPHSTCKLFDLDAAIKAMPIQLFLQVVGSAKKVEDEDTIEKYRIRLSLCDLPVQEYKCLMDTQATARLSCLIDNLRGLKLIRLVSGEVLDATKSHATLKHSLELKPYIEEPVTKVPASPGFVALDIRPQIRHNFVLSSRKAVDDYWNMLEYCYAAFDSKNALHAFPGFTIHERASNANGEKFQPEKCKQKFPSQKRKRCSERPIVNVKIDVRNGESSEHGPTKLSDDDDHQFTIVRNLFTTSSGEYEDMRNDFSDHAEVTEQAELSEDGAEDHSCIRERVLSKLTPIHQRKFSRTVNADRQLVIEYARHRAALGAKFHCTNWTSLPNPPASPNTCRRMTLLNSSGTVSGCSRPNTDSDRHDQYDCQHQKFIKLMNAGKVVNRRAYESMAISNAAELFKLVFLSISKLPNSLVETLKCYSEKDLLAAFNYLRESKIMVGVSGNGPYGLSRQFLQNLSSSPFPTSTGQRAAKMASFLHEREKDLLGAGIDLSADMQCGEVFHLCALLSSGEFSISPFLPDEGVGEAEASKILKRKSNGSDICDGHKAKKLNTIMTSEIVSRRDKGFPGIQLSLSRVTVSTVDAVALFKDGDAHVVALPLRGIDRANTSSYPNPDQSSSPSDYLKENIHSKSFISKTIAATEPPWEAMTCYAAHLMSKSSLQEQESHFYPDIFRNVYLAIEKAGDQGLSMKEISQVMGIQGEKLLKGPERIVEVLEAFGRALMVNAYDSVHVVSSLYWSKYFLTSKAGISQEIEADLLMDSRNSEPLIFQPENHEDCASNILDISMTANEAQGVSLLNHSEEIAQPSSKTQNINEIESYTKGGVISPGRDQEGETIKFHYGDSSFGKPILPWINTDGTINEIVYKGLVRNVLGIVMQNPGILQDNVLSQMWVLNPQICRKLLELMILDNHVVARKMYQATSSGPPAILGGLLRSKFKKSDPIYREHLFANPMSSSFL